MLNQLIEQSREYDSKKTDYGPFPVYKLRFNDTADLVVPAEMLFGNEVELQPTEWALGQICNRLGPAAFPGRKKALPAPYLSVCPPGMRAEQLNHWIGKLPPGREWFVRAYGNNCRAILTNEYSVVDVTETLEWTRDALDNHGRPVTIHRPVVTPDVLHLKVMERVIDVSGDGQGNYATGAYISTGEIGNRRIEVRPLVQRISCTNSIMAKGDAYFSHRHTGRRSMLRRLFIDAIFDVFEGALDVLERLLDAESVQLDDFAERVDTLVKNKGWTTVTRDSILLNAEGETMFDFIQAVSATANGIKDADERVAMQTVAGELLNG